MPHCTPSSTPCYGTCLSHHVRTGLVNLTAPDMQTMLSYYGACLALTRQLVRLLALSLKLDATYFDEDIATPLASLRPLHYTPAISKPDEVRFACDA